MVVTATAVRQMGIGNETRLSGTETILAELGESLNQAIAVSADDALVTIGNFTKANLDGLMLIADQACRVKVIGGNPWTLASIATVGDMVTNTGGTLTITGDLTEWLWPGDEIWIQGCTTPANDGRYLVIGTAVAAGVTTVEVIKAGIRAAAGVMAIINVGAVEVFDTVEAGAGAANLVTKIVQRGVKTALLGAAGNEFSFAGPPGEIDIAGDFSFLQVDDKILIEGATTIGNSIIFTVVSATFTTPDTTIVVEEAVANVEAAAAATTLQWVRTELLVRLVANIPYLWTRESQTLNPVLEDITRLLVSNASTTLIPDLQGRFVKSSP